MNRAERELRENIRELLSILYLYGVWKDAKYPPKLKKLMDRISQFLNKEVGVNVE